jgi:hypothetical protein
MKVISDTEKVLNMILGWENRKELGEPKVEGRVWEERQLVELRP